MLASPQPGKDARVRWVNRSRWGALGRIAQSYIAILYRPSYIDLISVLYRLFVFGFNIDCYAFAQHPRQFAQQFGLVGYGYTGVNVNRLPIIELPHAARF